MSERDMSYPFGRESVEAFAKRQAAKHGEPYGIWEHVGLYGQPTGDIEARHTFKAVALSKPDPSGEWALVSTVDPTDA